MKYIYYLFILVVLLSIGVLGVHTYIFVRNTLDKIEIEVQDFYRLQNKY